MYKVNTYNFEVVFKISVSFWNCSANFIISAGNGVVTKKKTFQFDNTVS